MPGQCLDGNGRLRFRRRRRILAPGHWTVSPICPRERSKELEHGGDIRPLAWPGGRGRHRGGRGRAQRERGDEPGEAANEAKGQGAAGALVKDATTASFAADVIAESARQPVLVDFWAPWCETCKQLAAVLEKIVKAAAGKVKLVRMNIDEHPETPGRLGVRSIPAVIAFQHGQPIDGFMGALSEIEVKAFVEGLAGPHENAADRLAEAEALLAAGDGEGAAELYAA